MIGWRSPEFLPNLVVLAVILASAIALFLVEHYTLSSLLLLVALAVAVRFFWHDDPPDDGAPPRARRGRFTLVG